ncbi:glycoprotein-N-acetylgalactosamine 3-beta-galactosyltransferase 1-like [Penaeus chinensis]|uniref:glycoprotein-N-acetylgalactosamine 3-beta-galactosyltransferase 1-like n=1 Tax=Penaeus chinensis TaxID=139456 RepID=UPI001FB84D8B|nr:glycoprotein-N-acetylgalactosamine 3-beta-galactosyltransferase 1-like [Penaeus chinensis]
MLPLVEVEELHRVKAETGSSQDLAAAIQLLKEQREARALYAEVRVLCWVPVAPADHNKTAVHVRATWGRRCNKLLFISTKDVTRWDIGFPANWISKRCSCGVPNAPMMPAFATVIEKIQFGGWLISKLAFLDTDPSRARAVNVGSEEGFKALWNKTRSALQYLYLHFLSDYEWFLKADDNTYVVLENLRYMLRAYDTNDPVYFGHHYRSKGGYNSGGAGYVLGRETLRRFVEKALHNEAICGSRRFGEDFQLGRCLRGVGVAIVDTRDHRQEGRFFQQHVREILRNPDIHSHIVYYPVKKDGKPDSCCSDTVISFHQMSVADLYMLDYLIYKVRVFGHIPPLPLKVPLPPDLTGVPNKTLQKYLLFEVMVRPRRRDCNAYNGHSSPLRLLDFRDERYAETIWLTLVVIGHFYYRHVATE